MERAFDPTIVEGFERSLERLDRTLNHLVTTLEKAGGAANALGASGSGAPPGGGGGSGPPPGGGGSSGGGRRDGQGRFVGGSGGGGGGAGQPGGGSGFWGRMASTAAGSYMGARMAGQRLPSALGTMASGSGFVGNMVSGIPIVGPALAGAVQGVQGMYGQYQQRQMGIAGGYGATGINQMGGGLQRAGVQQGLGPIQLASMMQGLSGQTGLTGDALQKQAPELLKMQRTMGFGNVGGILGAGGTAGGRTGGNKEMQLAISSGFQVGMREAKMDKFFQQMSGWIESLRTNGIDITPASALSLVRVVGNTGIQGEAATRLAQSMQGAVANAAGIGGGGFAKNMMLREALDMSGGNLADAMLYMEKNPDEITESMFNKLRQVSGGDEGVGQLVTQAFAQSAGIKLSAKQARAIGGGKGQVTDDATEGTAKGKDYQRGRTKGAAKGLGEARYVAGLEAERVGMGAQSQTAAREINRLELDLAKETLPTFTKAIRGTTETLKDMLAAYKEGGLSALVIEGAGSALETFTDTVETAGDAVGDFIGKTMGESPEEKVERHRKRDRDKKVAKDAVEGFGKGTGVSGSGPTASLDPRKQIVDGLEAAVGGARRLQELDAMNESDLGLPA